MKSKRLGTETIDIESPSTRREWIEIKAAEIRSESSCSSPSTRREWIEIGSCLTCSTDRPSPSTRREWIEIEVVKHTIPTSVVSLHTEGVD